MLQRDPRAYIAFYQSVEKKPVSFEEITITLTALRSNPDHR